MKKPARKVKKPAARAKKPSAKAKRPAAKAKKPQVKKIKIKGKIIGEVTHYFPKVRAAVIKLKAPLSVGEKIKIKGHTSDFQQAVTSMQIDRVPIDNAKKGEEIGLLVESRVRQGDVVLKV